MNCADLDLINKSKALGKIKLSLITAFVAAERYSSFIDAGDSLGVNHSTVRERVNKLEKIFGFVIFNERFKEDRPKDVKDLTRLLESQLKSIDVVASNGLYTGEVEQRDALERISVNAMRAFLALQGKIKRHEAAEQLDIDEAELSRMVSNIENGLRAGKLFERQTPVTFSPLGLGVVKCFRSFLTTLCELETAIKIYYMWAWSPEYLNVRVRGFVRRNQEKLSSLVGPIKNMVESAQRAKRSSKEREAKVAQWKLYQQKVRYSLSEITETLAEYERNLEAGVSGAGQMAMERLQAIWTADELKVSAGRVLIAKNLRELKR